MGRDSIQPFLRAQTRACSSSGARRTPAAPTSRSLELAPGEPLRARGDLADLWNGNGNVGLVVGATGPDELEELRELVPDIPFLVPGVGAQGGDAEAAVEHGLADGVGLVNSSRGIIFAGEDAATRRDDSATRSSRPPDRPQSASKSG